MEGNGAETLSRATQLADSTVLLVLTQTRRYGGRWHVAECAYSLIPLYPSHHNVTAIVTDRVLFRLSRNTGRPRGYRLRTVSETERWHREAPCWGICQHVQEPRTDGLTYHIEQDCTARCSAVQETVARNAITLGTTEARIRDLAGRRQKSRRYVSDDGDTLRALYGVPGRRVDGRDRAGDRGNATHDQVTGSASVQSRVNFRGVRYAEADDPDFRPRR